MKDFVDFLAKIIPPLKLFPEWVQLLVCVWIVFSAVVLAVLFFEYKAPPPAPTPPVPPTSTPIPLNGGVTPTKGLQALAPRRLPLLSKPWPHTNDGAIDDVLDRLNRLENVGESTETDLSSALRQFFQRPVIRHIREEPPVTAAYAFAYGDRLLEHYQLFYEEDKNAHDTIGFARTRLIKLQQILSKAFGQSQHFVHETFAKTSTIDEFLKEMKKVKSLDIDMTAERDANDTLQQLREALKKIGLWGTS